MRRNTFQILMFLSLLLMAGCGSSTTPAPVASKSPSAGRSSTPTPVSTKSTPAGIVTKFALPTPHYVANGIVAGPDGNLWFTEVSSEGNEFNVSKIGRITPSGTITEFALPKNSLPSGITAGPDGNLWFTDSFSDKIGRITTGR